MINQIIKKIKIEFDHRTAYKNASNKDAKLNLYKKVPEIKELDIDYNLRKIEIISSIKGNTLEVKEEIERINKEYNNKRQKILDNNNINIEKYIPSCKICNDTGIVDGNYCKCFKQMVANEVYKSEFYRESMPTPHIDEIDFLIYEKEKNGFSQRENVKNAVNILIDFEKNYKSQKGKNFMVYGPVAQGKTYILSAFAKYMIKKGYVVVYQTAPNLFEKLRFLKRSWYNDSSDFTNLLYDCDILIIDDLGKEEKNANVLTEVFNIVNMRYIANKSTIISTNLNISKFRNEYDEATFSRLFENIVTIHLRGKDLRLPL